jgi:hypothetical protein
MTLWDYTAPNWLQVTSRYQSDRIARVTLSDPEAQTWHQVTRWPWNETLSDLEALERPRGIGMTNGQNELIISQTNSSQVRKIAKIVVHLKTFEW